MLFAIHMKISVHLSVFMMSLSLYTSIKMFFSFGETVTVTAYSSRKVSKAVYHQ